MLSDCIFKLITLLGVLGGSLYTIVLLSRTNCMFRPFKKVGQVVGLFCQPLAGCKGMIGRSAVCTTAGMKLMGFCDKQFVVVKECGEDFSRSSPRGMLREFYTQAMDNMEAFSDGKDLILLAPGKRDYSLPAEVIKSSMKQLTSKNTVEQLWRGKNVMVGHKMEGASDWIHESLERDDVHIYHILDQIVCGSPGRSCRGNYVFAVKESMDYVNKELQPDPHMLGPYFRPNIILAGCEAMDECQWSYLKIGNVYFQVTCLDTSVVSTQIKQEGKEWKPSWEPPPELGQNVTAFHGFNLALDIGVNARVVRPGEIHVGDPVFAAYKL